MARIRSVKPDIRRSITVGQWPREVRLAFIYLWMYLDDSGRGLDDTRLLVAELFPLDRDVTEKKMDRWIDLMATTKRPGDDTPPLCRYEVAGQRYLHATKWTHQRINRPQPSRLPHCPIHESGVNESLSRSRPDSLNDSLNDSLSDSPPSRAPADQGAGSRERSREQGETAAAVSDSSDDDEQTADQLLDTTGPWLDPIRTSHRRTILEALHRHYPTPAIEAGLRDWATRDNPKPGLLAHLINDHGKPTNGHSPPGKPAWCGTCDQTTRLADTDAGPIRCPECHPLAASA